MDLGALDLNQLVSLQALLEEANVTRAGRRVGVSQPAMSGALARWRRHFGDELLVRDGREQELTPLARELLPQLAEALHLVRVGLRVDRFDPGTSEREFTLAAGEHAATVLLEPLRRNIVHRAPGVRLRFADAAGELAGSARTSLHHDVVVDPSGSVPTGPTGPGLPLFRDRLVCLVDAANPHLHEGRLDVEALRHVPHAVTVDQSGAPTLVDRLLARHGLGARPALQAQGFLLLAFAVLGTDHVALLPQRLARRFAGDPRWREVDVPFAGADWLEVAWWHPARTREPGHAWFLGVLRDVAAELALDDPAP